MITQEISWKQAIYITSKKVPLNIVAQQSKIDFFTN